MARAGAGGVDAARVERMQGCLVHRGPDGSGVWCGEAGGEGCGFAVGLGHRRLAVVERSEAGSQPMLWVVDGNGRGRVVTSEAWERGEKRHGGRVAGAIVYNGELYNDHELREELAGRGVVFTSGSDTETVVAAIGVWG
jgi:asparagine synthase (glutamine-hydrolysing)